MFAKKFVLVTAAVALALNQVAAEQEVAHLKIRVIHSNRKQALTVNETESASGSASAEESYIGAGEDEDEDEDDEDDEEEEGSSYADRDADVGYEEDDEDDDDDGSGSGKNEAAVIAPVKPSFPVQANGTANAAPAPLQGGAPAPAPAQGGSPVPAQGSASHSAACTGKGESPMSVEGVEGIFCVFSHIRNRAENIHQGWCRFNGSCGRSSPS